MIHETMEATVLSLSVLAFVLSISTLGIILVYYCCCREGERKKFKDDSGFAVKCDNKCDNTSIHGSIVLEESNKPADCEIDNLSEHLYEQIPSARASIEDMYIDDTIEDQKKYMDKISDTNQIPERFYHTLEDLNKKDNNTCECKGACYHIYH